MLFVKAAKVVGIALVFMPVTGIAIAVGLIFASLLKSISYAPDFEDILFNYAVLGFAFVESFLFILVLVAGALFVI